jgi:hypothetical protein
VINAQNLKFLIYNFGSTTNLMVQMKFCTIFYNKKKKMVLFNKPSRRHAELVSASPKTIAIIDQFQEMPKQVRHDVQGCCVLRKTVFVQSLIADFKFLIIRKKNFSGLINHELPLNLL